GLVGDELPAPRRLVGPVLAPVLGDMAAPGVDQDVLQHDPGGRVLDHDHHLVAAAALRRRAFIAGRQQHGFVEGEVDQVFALHGEDGIAVATGIAVLASLRAGEAGSEQDKDEDDSAGIRLHGADSRSDRRKGRWRTGDHHSSDTLAARWRPGAVWRSTLPLPASTSGTLPAGQYLRSARLNTPRWARAPGAKRQCACRSSTAWPGDRK